MGNLLFANDRPATYPDSYYAASAPLGPERTALRGAVSADVCVIGAGYTGLNAARRLAQSGRHVVVLEAHRVGWGASGRNGGQLGSGQRIDQPDLEAQLGVQHAHDLWDIAQNAKAFVKDVIVQNKIDCDLKPGIAHVNHRACYDDEAKALVDHMGQHYDYPLTYMPPSACRALVNSPSYSGGVMDEDAAHLHPLKYALGLAKLAEDAGATIYENCAVTGVDTDKRLVKTAQGQVIAKEIVLAGNGYVEGLVRAVEAHVMPINNFIIATEPLDEDARRNIISRDIAVADSKFVVNYYRFSADGRLLFGGRESYGYKFPGDIAGFVSGAMTQIFPQTKGLGIDFAWGGTLAITMSRLPYLREVHDGVWNASGYSGHGVAMASFAGHLMAQAILGARDQFDSMAAVPAKRFPGGRAMRSPLLVAAMLWYALRDRL